MKHAVKIALLVTSIFPLHQVLAVEPGNGLTTEWGDPDLQGVWNFSTEIPFERPERFGDREFLTQEEIQDIKARLEADAAAGAVVEADPDFADRGAPSTDERFVYGYDHFWYEMASIADTVRTSQIIYPRNGKLPGILADAPRGSSGFLEDAVGERPVRTGSGGIGKDGPEDRGLPERCILGMNALPPYRPSRYNNNLQIVQNRDHVVIMSEMIHNARIVPLTDLPPLPGDMEFWTGDSRGYWDGDTLVVETRNFSFLTASLSSIGTGKNKFLTERFTRTDYDTLDYQWTLEDPFTFSDKITAVLPMAKVAGQLYEYACQEGNYGLQNILRGAREEERRTAGR
ncbi:MAG: hypothetical protein R3F41_09630 [Gammaproteobacteria bacterium]|nr:hypothetical protein [Pseudomonadales bacterium]